MAANLSPSSIVLLRGVQHRFAVDYMDFYKSMIGSFRQARNEGRLREFVAAREDVEIVVEGIDKLLVPREKGVAQSEIDTVIANMLRVEKNLERHKEESLRDADLNEKLEKRIRDRQLDTTKLAQSVNQMRGRIEKKTKEAPSIAEQWKNISPETYGGVTGWGMDALKASMGAWGELGGAAISGVGGFMKRRAERKKTLEEQSFVGHILNAGEQTPEHFQSAMSMLTGRKPIEPSVTGGMHEFFKSPSVGGTKGAGAPTTPLGRTAVSGGGGGISFDDISEGIRDFNEHHAIRNGWTKELLKAVQEGNKIRSKETLGETAGAKTGGGLISKVFSEVWEVIEDFVLLSLLPMITGGLATIGAALAGVLGFAGAALGIGGALLGGIALGGLVNKIKIGDKTVGEHAQGWFGGMMGNTPEQNAARSRKEATPAGLKFQDAYDKFRGQGLGHAEAMEKARAAITTSTATEKGMVPLTSVTKTESVPITATEIKDQAMMEGSIHKDLLMIIEEIKKMGGSNTGMPNSGFDAFNIRNPLLSALSFGGVEIDE